MTNKIRIDLYLAEKGLAKSRTHAVALIMSGDVADKNGHKFEKAGQLVAQDRDDIIVKQKCPWVSRAGLKLEKALQYFSVNPKQKICLDIGASTGGFTEVLVTNNAKKIYAVDVGYGQMNYTLSKNNKVIVLDKTNARTLDRTIVTDKIDLKEARSDYEVLQTVPSKRFGVLNLVSLTPKTGRRHQLRIHLSGMGNPISTTPQNSQLKLPPVR